MRMFYYYKLISSMAVNAWELFYENVMKSAPPGKRIAHPGLVYGVDAAAVSHDPPCVKVSSRIGTTNRKLTKNVYNYRPQTSVLRTFRILSSIYFPCTRFRNPFRV